VKGPTNFGTRYEAERNIDVSVAVELVKGGGTKIIKNREVILNGKDRWVLDYFGGDNFPLVIAECERTDPVTDLSIPKYCKTEVTADYRFANDELSKNPFKNWGTQYFGQLSAEKPIFLKEFGENKFV
jgi:CYTH domain-containing protein